MKYIYNVKRIFQLENIFCFQGEWVGPSDVCVHDKLFTMIILIIILIMIVLIILLIFFIYYVLDSCLRIADKRNIKSKKLRNQRVLQKKTVEDNDVSDSTDESYYCSDDSYIYGKNLSIGNSKMYIWREHKIECFFLDI